MKKPIGHALALAVIDILQSERQARGLSYGKVAEAARLDRSTVQRSLKKERTPSLWLAYDIASALDLPFADVIATAERAVSAK